MSNRFKTHTVDCVQPVERTLAVRERTSDMLTESDGITRVIIQIEGKLLR